MARGPLAGGGSLYYADMLAEICDGLGLDLADVRNTTPSSLSFRFSCLASPILGAVTADEADRARVLGFLFRYFPTRLDFLTDQLDAFRAERLRIGLAGGLGLVWASLGFFGAVTSAVNEAWGVEKQRSFWKHRLVSFLMLVAASTAMAVALLFVSFFQVAETSRVGHCSPTRSGSCHCRRSCSGTSRL